MAKLFYVIGASGAGKDSLIYHVRQNMPEDASIMYAQRYITRPADAGGENHVALSVREFEHRKGLGCFAMHWFSHETHYGIGNEINVWLSNGLNVVMNGSRGYLQVARKLFPQLVPVLISVDPEILSDRLYARGRESSSQIKQRLIQAIKLENEVKHYQLIKIDNNGLLEDAGNALLNSILNNQNEKCA
ncbi:MAG: phosphonate metabolism protein/1,5-bisphosphokinase (PRPP-forming) PhnN [Gammaproteobacteria bacterium]|nr:phosphonate metabolism protein/1,5-bisphosphokinase (PRPP-forming) PhnN [Gammaproteobacteria bacterium]